MLSVLKFLKSTLKEEMFNLVGYRTLNHFTTYKDMKLVTSRTRNTMDLRVKYLTSVP